MKDQKPPFMPGQQIQTRRGPGCGCFAGGCGVVLLVLVLMCVGSYYVTMHTSFPLAMIKYGIESDGNVRVNGLRGSIANGFEIDQLEFQSEEYRDRWNELRDIKFRFNGFYDLIRNKRFIIKEVSVSGGTIFAKIDDQGQFDFDSNINGEEFAEEFADEIEDVKREFEDDDLDKIREVRIDLVSFSNIEIVNPDSELKLEFEKVEFKNFEMRHGEIQRLGDLTVVSDQIELETSPSAVFADDEVAWNFKGLVKSPVHKSMTKDLPFDVDFAIVDGNNFRSRFDLFGGQVKLDDPYAERRIVELKGFSPSEYFELSKLVPSNWNVVANINPPSRKLTGDDSDDTVKVDSQTESAPKIIQQDPRTKSKKSSRKKRKPLRQLTIEPGGQFDLGDTTFTIETESVLLNSPDKNAKPIIKALGQREGQPISAKLLVLPKTPYVEVTLSSDNEESRDLWAKLFYQQSYDDLPQDLRSKVDATLSRSEAKTSDSDDPSE